jgi:hypothetical protein
MPKTRLLIFMLLLRPNFGLSQTQTTPHHHRAAKKQPSSNTTKYLMEPFDVTTSNLEPGFRGHDIAAVWKAVTEAEKPRAKLEFETSGQYSERMAKLGGVTLLGNIENDNYLVFMVEEQYSGSGDGDPDAPMGGGTSFDPYNADKQIFKVALLGNPYLGKDAIPIRSVRVGGRHYTASNAFGAKISVTETDSLKYGLVFEPLSWVFPDAYGDFRLFYRTISMVPEKARVFLLNPQILIICKLTQDHRSFSSQASKAATFDSPDSTNIEKRYVHAKPEQIWVIDGSTGDVLRKFSESSNASDSVAVTPPLRKSPLVVQLSMTNKPDIGLVYVRTDDGKEEVALFKDNVPVFYADKKVQLRWLVPPDLSRLLVYVNGTPYVPKWQQAKSGSFLYEASAVITIGN